jgi:hypothetical protein
LLANLSLSKRSRRSYGGAVLRQACNRVGRAGSGHFHGWSFGRKPSEDADGAVYRGKPVDGKTIIECGVYEILIIWVSADYTGANAAFAERGRWANLRAEINNRGSSFVMGDHSGHLAEGQDGLGFWYPGDTGICAHEKNLNTNGSGWNNRISSRFRN